MTLNRSICLSCIALQVRKQGKCSPEVGALAPGLKKISYSTQIQTLSKIT